MNAITTTRAKNTLLALGVAALCLACVPAAASEIDSVRLVDTVNRSAPVHYNGTASVQASGVNADNVVAVVDAVNNSYTAQAHTPSYPAQYAVPATNANVYRDINDDDSVALVDAVERESHS